MPVQKKPAPTEEDSLILKRAGFKITRPRLALLRVLRSQHGPFTMEQLHQKLKKEGCDLVTVYRCINAFQEACLVRRCDFGDGPVRFELAGEAASHHHHIVCRRCKKVKNLDYCLVEAIEKVLSKQGYHNVSHSLEFFGDCSNCLKPEPPKARARP